MEGTVVSTLGYLDSKREGRDDVMFQELMLVLWIDRFVHLLILPRFGARESWIIGLESIPEQADETCMLSEEGKIRAWG
jgi:hypothetical protein